MAQPLRKIEPETRSYSERILELVEADKVGGARRLLAEALEHGAQEEGLAYWQKVLAKGGPGRPVKGEPDFDRTPDIQWIREHSETYRGQWVAVLGGELLAHSQSLDEVVQVLEQNKPARSPLLHYIDRQTTAERLKKIEPETRSYSERILELVEADLVGGARRLLAEALEKGSQEEDLAYWQKVLAKGGPGRPVKGEPDFDRTPEIEWIREHSEPYRGQWVALLGSELLAHSQSIDEVFQVLEQNKPARRPMLHYID